MHSVNPRSRVLWSAVRALGACAALVVVAGAPAIARADRVVLLPAGGDVEDEMAEAIEEAVAVAIRANGHEALTERGAAHLDEATAPESANEMRAIAELQSASWVIAVKIDRNTPAGYWLTIRAGYAPATRLEEIEAEVRRSHEAERLRALFAALLRPEGLGHDIADLAGEDRAGREADAQTDAERAREAERLRAEQQAREAFEARERERAERETRDAWEGRARYGTPSILIEGGIGVRPLVQTSGRGTGGTLGAIELRVGYGLSQVKGLELRGGLDILFGTAGGFGLYGGAAYLGSPWAGTPVHIGGSVELGFAQLLTGSRTGGVLLRAAPVLSWRFHGKWYLEGALPELMWLSAGAGGVTIGASARVGYRL